MPGLSIPTPDLKYDAVEEGLAVLEKPIEVRCGPVVLPEGTTFGPEHLGTAGLLIYRQQAGAAVEIWDDEAQAWTAMRDPAEVKPLPFFFSPDEPAFPWQGLLMAAGQKDKDGADRFEKADENTPHYFFRSYFSLKGDAATGLSSPSADLRFISLLDTMRAGIRAGEGEGLQDATEIRLFLHDDALQPLGSVAIYNVGGQARIEIARQNGGASPVSIIRLNTDGSIEIDAPVIRLRAAGGTLLELTADTFTVNASNVPWEAAGAS